MEDRIINALKNSIEMRGYVENLGQKELATYEAWLKKQPLSYAQQASKYQAMVARIDAL